MKRLDDTTLEVIAETICGSGDSGTGGASYGAPGPYRSKTEICNFFRRAGVAASGESSTRKWFALESLQALNQGKNGGLVPSGISSVLQRLANPLEYRNDSQTLHDVVQHLNHILQSEGLELFLNGVSPTLRPRTASVPAAKPKFKSEPSPDFRLLVSDAQLAEILAFRWAEAQRCVEANAYLSAVIMMGSILEGVLLHKVETNIAVANHAKSAPFDKKLGKPRPIQDWGLSGLIDVAHELKWLQGDMKRFSHALKESRNVVHPYVQRLYSEVPDIDTCNICWQVVRAGVADLLDIEQKKP